jgi:hypothetical protein
VQDGFDRGDLGCDDPPDIPDDWDEAGPGLSADPFVGPPDPALAFDDDIAF